MQKLTPSHIESFKKIIGANYVFLDEETLHYYASDQTEQLVFKPEVVLKPASAKEISEILKTCNENLIPVTPRGGGTGLSGGALPYLGGVLLSTERLNNIIAIDERNLQVTTEPGVITEVLQEAVKEKGLFYPPDPASRGSCFIGGNIAENSGGAKAVKYGVVSDYVLNLEVVLPTGEIIWTGANVLKNVTGYNLTQLLVGSEGTLGVVTKIVLKLLPYPKYEMTMLAAFNSIDKACETITKIFVQGHTPSGLELIEKDALHIVSKYVATGLPLGDDVAAHLIIEVDGNNEEALMQQLEAIAMLIQEAAAGEILLAVDAQQKEELWKLRRRAAESVKADGYTIEEDTVVPRAEIAKLIAGVKQLGIKHQFLSACYGHAGDGNIHVRIKKEGFANSFNNETVHLILRELFELVKSLGGTITAEHGIGLIQKEFMDIVFTKRHIGLMHGIKKVFDPNNILNPGKIFD